VIATNYVVPSQYGSRHTCTQEAPHIGSAPTRFTLPDFIDCIYSHQLNNFLCTAFITT